MNRKARPASAVHSSARSSHFQIPIKFVPVATRAGKSRYAEIWCCERARRIPSSGFSEVGRLRPGRETPVAAAGVPFVRRARARLGECRQKVQQHNECISELVAE